jgi:Xaa-Pro aminopeptidase
MEGITMAVSSNSPAPLFDMERMAAAMDRAGLAAVVSHSQRNFYYLSGFRSLDYVIEPEAANYIVLPRDPSRPAFVTIPSSERLAVEDEPIWVPRKVFCGNFFVHQSPPQDGLTARSTFDGLVLAVQEGGLAECRVGFELELMPVAVFQGLRSALPRMEIADASPLLRLVRMVKTQEELRRLRTVCEITEQAINESIPQVRPGMRDYDLAEVVAGAIVARGAEVLYVQVALPGAAGLGLPVGRKFENGQVVRLDVAAICQQYNSDLGRGFVLGDATPEQKDTYRAAIHALQAGIDAVRAGCQAKDIFNTAMAAWSTQGYSHVRRHHVGHGLGLQAHEAPLLKPTVDEVIQPNMVLAIEVPYYIYGHGGFAPEDALIVGADSNTRLTHVPSELPVVG